MKSKAMLFLCRLLVLTVMSLSFQAANAGMIGVDQVIASSTANADREAVLRVLGRTEVSSQLQSLGLDAKTASERVAAMTDQEVHSLAGKLESLPAGASSDWGWGLLAVILIAAAIYYVWGWKK
ncbi:MAG TPA: PA2779 family protein [Rhodocyclaceae bacterium]|nr:PA2779 family protein [Rhodocyclaceae bacterium]